MVRQTTPTNEALSDFGVVNGDTAVSARSVDEIGTATQVGATQLWLGRIPDKISIIHIPTAPSEGRGIVLRTHRKRELCNAARIIHCHAVRQLSLSGREKIAQFVLHNTTVRDGTSTSVVDHRRRTTRKNNAPVIGGRLKITIVVTARIKCDAFHILRR